MPLLTLRGHFDGQKICLDEPIVLTPNIQLIVTILSDENEPPRPANLCLKDAIERWQSFPRLADEDIHDFEKDIHDIRRQLNKEELNDYSSHQLSEGNCLGTSDV